MAYKKSDLEAQALEAIQSKKLVFLDEVVCYLPCSERTFYNYKLQELQSIKDAIEKNKVDLKGGIRKKLYDNKSPAALIALYKLLGTDEEAARLNGSNKKLELSGGVKHEQIRDDLEYFYTGEED
jgi:hypothetical protein